MRKRTRRDFAKSLALLAATPLVAAAGQGDVAPESKETVAQALHEMVRIRYGKHLTEEQQQAIKSRIDRNLRAAERLKQVPLKNSDEPAFIFSAEVF